MRRSAKRSATFVTEGTASAAQIEFINMMIEHLTDQGMMDPGLLYDSPFTDIAPQGPEQVFDDDRVIKLFQTIDQLNNAAVV